MGWSPVLGSALEGGILPPGDTRMISLTWKLRLPPGHFELLLPLNQRERRVLQSHMPSSFSSPGDRGWRGGRKRDLSGRRKSLEGVCKDTMEYYSAIRKDGYLPFASTWMELEGIMLSEIHQSEKDKHHMVSLIWH
ncbi:unnamed protein product [Nyctereutes procyonoides]|uniref:(raccoon dog) hypothetical protein n=1 Tax=Nyctereutes procyonoides TaxID=34880 RepID=A0A811Z041_NYCPR|nr:unnamed protein product [Nyctereutes procyonoides]